MISTAAACGCDDTRRPAKVRQRGGYSMHVATETRSYARVVPQSVCVTAYCRRSRRFEVGYCRRSRRFEVGTVRGMCSVPVSTTSHGLEFGTVHVRCVDGSHAHHDAVKHEQHEKHRNHDTGAWSVNHSSHSTQQLISDGTSSQDTGSLRFCKRQHTT